MIDAAMPSRWMRWSEPPSEVQLCVTDGGLLAAVGAPTDHDGVITIFRRRTRKVTGKVAPSTYLESGYTISRLSGTSPAFVASSGLGTAPFLELSYNAAPKTSESFQLTRTDGSAFSFSGFDAVADPAPGDLNSPASLARYQITEYDDNGRVIGSSNGGLTEGFASYSSGYAGTNIGKVVFSALPRANQGSSTVDASYFVDNLRVSDVPGLAVTPEPSSFLLLATGAFGIAGVLRKRLFA